MIVEEQLTQWEQWAKYRNFVFSEISPTIILLLIDEVRNQNKMINQLSTNLVHNKICTKLFTDCDINQAPIIDCIKCWENKIKSEINNENS